MQQMHRIDPDLEREIRGNVAAVGEYASAAYVYVPELLAEIDRLRARLCQQGELARDVMKLRYGQNKTGPVA